MLLINYPKNVVQSTIHPGSYIMFSPNNNDTTQRVLKYNPIKYNNVGGLNLGEGQTAIESLIGSERLFTNEP